jgi:hypothetical protein
MGRAVPHRSLPPCGGGTGRGVQQRCFWFVSTIRQVTPNAAGRRSRVGEESRLQCFVATPLPVPPPQGGREPWGTHLRNSHNVPVGFQRYVPALGLSRGRTETCIADLAKRNQRGVLAKRNQRSPARRHASPISRRISAVCSPSRGEGRGDATGLPPIMIGVRTPGILPSLAASLASSSRMPR